MGNDERGRPVGVVGSGVMGTGIAQVALDAGERVVLYGRRATALQAAREGLAERLRRREASGRAEPGGAAERLARLRLTTDLSELRDARLVVESVAEDFAAKADLLRRVEAVVPGDSLIATNTSSLSVTGLAAALRRPERFAGLHFFNPAPAMRLVEVVAARGTAEATCAALSQTARRWGKAPVRSAARPGFVVNRIARPYYGEALRALEEGAADPATIDAVLTEAGGFRMGPFALMDLIGNDVNEAVTRGLWRAFHHDPRYTPSQVQRELVEAGHLGRKVGRGFFDYPAGPAGPAESPAPATWPPVLPPSDGPAGAAVRARGDLGPAEPLVRLLREAGVEVAVDGARPPGQPPTLELPDGTLLRLTDGRTAGEHARETDRPVGLLDLSHDYRAASRLALAFDDRCPAAARAEAVRLLQRLGKAVTELDDLPGLLVFRTVAMLVNEAADAVLHRIAAPDDVDSAMRLGANHPAGPLEWGDRVGPRRVLRLLENLGDHYRDGRYRPSPLLRRRSLADLPLRAGRVPHPHPHPLHTTHPLHAAPPPIPAPDPAPAKGA
ncbi:3-hydroxyacyl-CoA dehydrogenase [Allostreptomyces psammosilenae]|uniref:3-hydroxybutyryl-CoA dehydrogenase n=1 Tax=Allostreptomyces psammosilenae TaxID=1892865 RepID=A0A852ZQ85_9ACTN|nr:3-hydroxyacyl-CoA dehydrogenase [Allostreptomyces psammosilenae]NYI04539.1 3-hydroxybutyryl-CoA dehydrogenase [Allostreptomyces psammosilenae]